MRLKAAAHSSRLWQQGGGGRPVIDGGADCGSLASPHLSASARVSASTRRCEKCSSAGANGTRCLSIQPTPLSQPRALKQIADGVAVKGPLATFATAGPRKRAREGQEGTYRTKGPRQTPCFLAWPANRPPTTVGQLQPRCKKTCVRHLRACRAPRACCATRGRHRKRYRQIQTNLLKGITLGRPEPLLLPQHPA